MTKLRLLDLFSGIGGFSLGLERSGAFKTVAFCEIEPFCRCVLAKHWPDIPCYEDVRSLSAKRLDADGIAIDAICGGFPCQDISVAGKGAGLSGERSGLWKEYARLIGEIRPRFVIVENVAALLCRGLADVLGDLAAFGYDAEWHCIPASYLGAQHRRDRIWIVAYSFCAGVEGLDIQKSVSSYSEKPCGWEPTRAMDEALSADDYSRIRGTYDGVPKVMDRLKGLGNAVVPQIPELIGRAIMASMIEAAE